MGFALPNLLFNECHKTCVDSEISPAINKEQVTCITNCQEKTYKAFDLYLRMQVIAAKQKTYRDFVDISKFTGMEVEHAHDTTNKFPHNDELHVNPDSLEGFRG
ncbi:MAG: Tim10/DDP family zinc finger protein [Candidatus Roizmanbacteria bacterium]